jgi:glycosyltransferase involved in cell wall biosynthesis
VGGGDVAVLHPPDQPDLYPLEVRARIRRDRRVDYRRAARELNEGHAEVVSIQHEYGIWGGPDGEYVLDLVGGLVPPIVATLHTVMRRPSVRQRAILGELARVATAVVVMSHAAARLLEEVYEVDPASVRVIPHGVPEVRPADPAALRRALGLTGRRLVLSFGLLGPGKGYEYAIEAMREIAAAAPDALYVILGATHPQLLRREGERYRRGLQDDIARLGLEDHVWLIDRFATGRELGHWLVVADAFVTPYPHLEQIVSGTLAYALGAGKAIVSTPYAYAREVLDQGRGVLVPARDPRALATALGRILDRPDYRASLAARAYDYGRQMTWPRVGLAYRTLFEAAARRVVPTREAVHA